MQNVIDISWPALLERVSKERSLSQYGLADALGVDQSTVCRIASGAVKDPRASLAIRLLQLAGGRIEVPAPNEEARPNEVTQ